MRVTYEPSRNDQGPLAWFVRPEGGARGAPPPQRPGGYGDRGAPPPSGATRRGEYGYGAGPRGPPRAAAHRPLGTRDRPRRARGAYPPQNGAWQGDRPAARSRAVRRRRGAARASAAASSASASTAAASTTFEIVRGRGGRLPPVGAAGAPHERAAEPRGRGDARTRRSGRRQRLPRPVRRRRQSHRQTTAARPADPRSGTASGRAASGRGRASASVRAAAPRYQYAALSVAALYIKRRL